MLSFNKCNPNKCTFKVKASRLKITKFKASFHLLVKFRLIPEKKVQNHTLFICRVQKLDCR